MKINERSIFIINKLVQNDAYITASEIANQIGVSIKTITRQLVEVEKIIGEFDLELERKTSKGMRLIGDEKQKQKLLEFLQVKNIHEYSPIERQNIILSQLLKNQEPIKLISLAKLLDVTEATISNDLDKLAPWINKMNMDLVRRPGLGIYLEGLEKDIRKAIINHIYENIHEEDILTLLYNKQEQEIINEADKFLLDLVDKNIIQQVEQAVNKVLLKNYNVSMIDFSALVVHLTLAVQRLLKGEFINIDNKFLEQLQTKYEYTIANKISESIAKTFQVKVPESETAYITMHLLGARSLYQESLTTQYDNFLLIKIAKAIIAIAEREANVAITKKSKLLVDLVKHLGPAASRMKMHMEIRNPLLKEMKGKYPHWMDIAKKSIQPLEKEIGCVLPEAEIAYIAMHLGAALEESSSEKIEKYNILVACPTGIGTSKLLSSQIKKKFNNLNVKAIVSAVNIDYKRYIKEGIDFIISTVAIEKAQLPVVVVNFMLNPEDIEKIVKQMQTVIKSMDIPSKDIHYSLIIKMDKLSKYQQFIKEILNNFVFEKDFIVNNLDELYQKVSNNVFCVQDNKILKEDLYKRELKGSTVVKGLMLLHAKTIAVKNLMIGVMQLTDNLIVNDEKVTTILVLLAPKDADEIALETIGCISENIVGNLNLLEILYQAQFEEIYLELERIYTKFLKEKYQEIMEE